MVAEDFMVEVDFTAAAASMVAAGFTVEPHSVADLPSAAELGSATVAPSMEAPAFAAEPSALAFVATASAVVGAGAVGVGVAGVGEVGVGASALAGPITGQAMPIRTPTHTRTVPGTLLPTTPTMPPTTIRTLTLTVRPPPTHMLLTTATAIPHNQTVLPNRKTSPRRPLPKTQQLPRRTVRGTQLL